MSAWMVCDKQISVVLTKAVGLGVLLPCEVQQMGQNIVNANCKSLEALYGANEEMIDKHKFVYYKAGLSPDGYILYKVSDFQAHKYAHCIDYQSCEYKTWKKSKSYKFIKTLCKTIEDKYGMTYKDISKKKWEGLNWSFR